MTDRKCLQELVSGVRAMVVYLTAGYLIPHDCLYGWITICHPKSFSVVSLSDVHILSVFRSRISNSKPWLLGHLMNNLSFEVMQGSSKTVFFCLSSSVWVIHRRHIFASHLIAALFILWPVSAAGLMNPTKISVITMMSLPTQAILFMLF